MTPNHLIKPFSLVCAAVSRWSAVSLRSLIMGLMLFTLVWQASLPTAAAANLISKPNFVMAADAGTKVERKVNEDAGRAKGFIRDTADKVERTANKNASRVDRATDDGSYVERKAKRDADRIEERSERDAARTQKAVDQTKNAVERAVDNVKDALGG
jgi:hypothetical protein